ncbi:MAG: 3'-5' exoribonuclease [Candidatus Pacearchaeota archaeon]
MKYFFDTEFIEKPQKIDLISIGIVSEEGKEAYYVNKECKTSEADDWVQENVLSKMLEYDPENEYGFSQYSSPTSGGYVLTKNQIRINIMDFLVNDKNPEFWAYYADYDWVVFCWLFGRMIDLPKHFPFYCRDLQQLIDDREIDKNLILEIFPQKNIHNALDDARWNKKVFDFIQYYK